ncbi:MAG TPA: hypothetical protein VI854_07085, partial [Acidimicrobiia bacterium]|nr:hypothetical protein [Acidimicrobiia bacterium]
GPERSRAKVRAAFMAATGLEHRAAAVAALYADFADGFVLDVTDAEQQPEIEALGPTVLLADTLAPPAERAPLARSVLDFARSLR